MTSLIFGTDHLAPPGHRPTDRPHRARHRARRARWQKYFTYRHFRGHGKFEKMGIPAAGRRHIRRTVELVGGIRSSSAAGPIRRPVRRDRHGRRVDVRARPNGVFVDDGGYELVLVIGALGVFSPGWAQAPTRSTA